MNSLSFDCAKIITVENHLSPKDVSACICVSRRWRVLFSHNDIWKPFLSRMGIESVANNLELYTTAFYQRSWINAKSQWSSFGTWCSLGLKILQIGSYKPTRNHKSFYSVKRAYDRLFSIFIKNIMPIPLEYIEQTPILMKKDFTFRWENYQTVMLDVRNNKMTSSLMKGLIIGNNNSHTPFFVYKYQDELYFFHAENLADPANQVVLRRIFQKEYNKIRGKRLFRNADRNSLKNPIMKNFFGENFVSKACVETLDLIGKSYANNPITLMG